MVDTQDNLAGVAARLQDLFTHVQALAVQPAAQNPPFPNDTREDVADLKQQVKTIKADILSIRKDVKEVQEVMRSLVECMLPEIN